MKELAARRPERISMLSVAPVPFTDLRRLAVVILCVGGHLLIPGCAGEQWAGELHAPGAPFAIIKESDGTSDCSLLLMWTEGGELAVGYNVYRKTGGGKYGRLNSSLIKAGPLGHDYGTVEGLAFTDTTIDKSSTSAYSYYVAAVDRDGLQSQGSDLVVCVPDDIALGTSVAGLTPDTSSTVSSVPTFTWAPIPHALSYCIVVMSVESENSGSVKWIHRMDLPPAEYKKSSGSTYVDVGGDALEKGAGYRWMVIAIDSENCAFAFGEASFSVEPE